MHHIIPFGFAPTATLGTLLVLANAAHFGLAVDTFVDVNAFIAEFLEAIVASLRESFCLTLRTHFLPTFPALPLNLCCFTLVG